MTFENHHIGPIASVGRDNTLRSVDVGALVRRLILFDRCTLESHRLLELEALVRVFDVGGLRELITAGAVQVICDVSTVGQIGQRPDLEPRLRRGTPLPTGAVHLAGVRGAVRHQYLHGVLKTADEIGLSFKDAKRLRGFLGPRLGTYPVGTETRAVDNANADLAARHPLVTACVRTAMIEVTGIDL